ncbi:MAG: hypothetical protein GY729_06450, partial [Desulfobacteraceae bacterium]|nr:hypothetical protein [Desulfobacteraceae bacterium]
MDKPLLSQSTMDLILENRDSFSNYNMVRMREALRYLSKEKVKLFTDIPFFIHINLPQFPGFVDDKVQAHGIWGFEKSGFFKASVDSGMLSTQLLQENKPLDPAVIAFYHIGSLGTFTQSIGSDFDYWVIIDKSCFSDERY